jgi:hypothetical protein
MANSSLATHGEGPDDYSMFAWFISAMVLAASISVNIVWKLLMTCYHRFVIQHGDANHVHNQRGSGYMVANHVHNERGSEYMVEKNHASTQTTEPYGSNHGVGTVYVTKCGERWHNARCGHIIGRPTKMLTPCSDCTAG